MKLYLKNGPNAFGAKSEIIDINDAIAESSEFPFGLIVAAREELEETDATINLGSIGYGVDRKGRLVLKLEKPEFKTLRLRVAEVAMRATDYVINSKEKIETFDFARKVGAILINEREEAS